MNTDGYKRERKGKTDLGTSERVWMLSYGCTFEPGGLALICREWLDNSFHVRWQRVPFEMEYNRLACSLAFFCSQTLLPLLTFDCQPFLPKPSLFSVLLPPSFSLLLRPGTFIAEALLMGYRCVLGTYQENTGLYVAAPQLWLLVQQMADSSSKRKMSSSLAVLGFSASPANARTL
eukprot:scaffold217315_cov18-Tisochrysis_lutea.AAC.1